MLATNYTNFEMFGSPYCLLNIDLPNINNSTKLYIFSKNANSPPSYTPFLFNAKENAILLWFAGQVTSLKHRRIM